MNRRNSRPVPVIDLFAGPGGLGEGFSSLRNRNTDERIFKIGLSIEKDAVAHATLRLRSFFRAFDPKQVPDEYYQLLAGKISAQELLARKEFAEQAQISSTEALQAEMGKVPDSFIDAAIERALTALGGAPWVLIGGPPCQAFSLAGRSRMSGESASVRDKDPRHLLYKEYLRVIARFQPDVFVMENVKGILSSPFEGDRIFDRIIDDLSTPGSGLSYQIRSFIVPRCGTPSDPRDYVIRSELFSIPQTRHRVLLLGIKTSHSHRVHRALAPSVHRLSLSDAISNFPTIRSRISSRSRADWGDDSHENWLRVLSHTPKLLKGWRHPLRQEVVGRIEEALAAAEGIREAGKKYWRRSYPVPREPALANWQMDARLDHIADHESRTHMAGDLQRYLFLSSCLDVMGKVPKVDELPVLLRPNHENVSQDEPPHKDRFKVQTWSRAAGTITSHIAKDGHYFIHPDPAQSRSLTVREAARIQTFPDNYFFVGPQTEQYAQVGNAVPPLLARQIAEVVADLLERI